MGIEARVSRHAWRRPVTGPAGGDLSDFVTGRNLIRPADSPVFGPYLRGDGTGAGVAVEYAGLGIRLVAYLIDLVIVSVLAVLGPAQGYTASNRILCVSSRSE
jgi:hypothetical protein